MESAKQRFSKEKLFSFIDELQLDLAAHLKGHFCQRFGNHNTFVDFLEHAFLISDALIFGLQSRFVEKSISNSDADLPDFAARLLQMQEYGEPVSAKIRRLREVLLLSATFHAKSYQAAAAGDFRRALRYHGSAEIFFGFYVGAADGVFGQFSASSIAATGASAKLARDPKQKTKAKVRAYWERWQSNPSLYQGPEAFAKDMFRIFGPESDVAEDEAIQNIESPRRWHRDWKKAKIDATQLAE